MQNSNPEPIYFDEKYWSLKQYLFIIFNRNKPNLTDEFTTIPCSLKREQFFTYLMNCFLKNFLPTILLMKCLDIVQIKGTEIC